MITSDQGRRVFALEIGGLTYRYHSSTPPSSSNLDTNIATGISYDDRQGIISVGAFSASIDPSGGVGEYSPVQITLAIDRQGDQGDAGVIFGRCGARSTATSAQITETVDRDDSIIRVGSSLTSLSYPRLLHIGAETVRVSAATASVLSVPSGRGVGNTPVQSHSISLEGSSVPEVATEITTFRGRRAKLFGAHRYADGSTSDYVEIINGIIEASPAIEAGETVSLSIVPLTALIDTSLSDKVSQTRLLSGYHHYDGQYGSAIEYATELNAVNDDFVFAFPLNAVTLTANTYQIQLFNDTLPLIGQINGDLTDFDASLPAGDDVDRYSVSHPRYPRFQIATGAYAEKASYPTSLTDITASTYTTYQVIADSSPSNALTAAELDSPILTPLPRTELKRHALGDDEVKRWPDVINDVLESDGPSTTSGLTGAVARWRLDTDDKVIASKLSDSSFPASVYLWTTQAAWMAHSNENYAKRPRFYDSIGDTLELDTLSRLSYPLDIGEGDDPKIDDFRETNSAIVKQIKAEPTAGHGEYQLRSVANAYHQLYESTLLVENSLGLPSSATAGEYYWLTVRYFHRGSGETRTQTLQATHETVATFNSANVGYLIHLRAGADLSRNTSFGDWPGEERALIVRGGRFVGERVGVALLKLLESGGGDEINGDYDVLSVGLNIPSSEIDEASFLAVDSTSPFLLSDQYAGDGADLRSTFESICKLLGAALVMRRDEATGKSKIALVSIGAERAADTSIDITAGDWFVEPPPSWGIYEDIVTQIEFSYDFDPAEEKFKSEVLFNDQEAINRYGGERSKISLELPGVSSDQFGRGVGDAYDQFLPTAGRLFNLLANPLRTWRGAISTGSSIYLDLGSYVKASSPHLRGYGDEYGVTDGVAMVRSINQELMNEGCELEMITTGLDVVAWNASANVATVPDATSITVSEDTFSDSSVDDVSFFKAGDVVDYVPTGDQDNAITGLTIDSIAGNTITFTAAHGISSAAGSIEPTVYSSASSHHQNDGYLANSSNVINSNVDAQKYN